VDLLKKIWKWRVAIVVAIIACWLYYDSVESEKKRVLLEKQIAEQAAEKKAKEELLFQAYNKLKNSKNCNIGFKVILETYGADVSVELRVGEIGNSFPLVVKQAKSSELEYKNLCPSNYFIAIGDDKTVSTTPVQNFESGKTYTSRVQLTQGVGNMGSARRETL
jgi:hypothetical protein